MLHWSGMRLAPGVFMRADVGGFAKVELLPDSALGSGQSC